MWKIAGIQKHDDSNPAAENSLNKKEENNVVMIEIQFISL
jgi:hypothetical protein